MEKLYNRVSQYTCGACTCLCRHGRQEHAQAQRRNRKNVSQKYNSSTDIFFRYRKTVVGKKEKEDKGIGGIQFLPTNIQEDKRGKLCRIVFRKRKPAELGGKHNGISHYPCL